MNKSAADRNIYIYDGSFEGFLTTVFHVWGSKGPFGDIVSGSNDNPGFFDNDVYVTTDTARAARVYNWISQKLPEGTIERVYDYFMSEDEGREKRLYLYLRACERLGRWTDSFLTNDAVRDFLDREKYFDRELDHMRGWTRFSVLEGNVMFAEIKTEFNQLLRLGRFFLDRMPGTRFMIYDGGRHKAVVSDGRACALINDIKAEQINKGAAEDGFEKLWKSYLKALTIEERKNVKLQTQLLPLKYRRQMTEFR